MTISPTQKRRLTATLLKNLYAKAVLMILVMFLAISGFILPQSVSLVRTQASTDKSYPQHHKKAGPGNSLGVVLPTETDSPQQASFIRENAVDGWFRSAADIATGFNWRAESNALWNPNLVRDLGAARAPYRMASNTGARLAISPIATQVETNCLQRVDPESKDFDVRGGIFAFDVIAEPGCPWEIAQTISWIHAERVADSVRYSVDGPNQGQDRTSKIRIVKGEKVVFHEVFQSGAAGPPTPTISFFTANPSSITSGQSSTLRWESINGTSAAITGVGDNLAPSGEALVFPTATTTYTLTVRNGTVASAPAMTTVTVTAPGDPIITSFTANPSSISSGQSSTLRWESTGGTSATITGVGDVLPTGSVVVSPTTTTTYTLTVRNSTAASAPESTTVTLALPGAPIITSFTANPSSITSGQSSTLSWASSGGTSATITGVGSVPLSGSVSVSPTITTTYTLTVTNSTSSVTASTTVTVMPSQPGAPIITSFAANSSSISSGQSSTLSWASSGGTSATITGVGSVPLSGSVSVSPTITTTYTLTVSNSTASVTASTTVTVTLQSNCTFELSPKIAFVGEGEAGFNNSLGFTVTPKAGCHRWTATATESWIVIKEETKSGEGKGSIIYTVTDNTNTKPRCGNIVVGDEKHTVIQAAGGSTQVEVTCPNSSPTILGQIVLDQIIHGTLSENDETSVGLRGSAFFRDRYAFRLEKKQEVAINVASADFDPFLFLLNGQGQRIAGNDDDDGAGFRSSRLPRLPAKEEYLLLDPGLYFVEVTSFSIKKVRGNYALYLASKEMQAMPIILTAIVDQKSLIVIGENFAEGAKLFIKDSTEEEKATTNDGSRSRTALIALKSAKKVKKGPATLRVLNPNGKESDVFVYPARP